MMTLHQGDKRFGVRVLLDTGCSVALINKRTVETLQLKKREYRQAQRIESYTGESVPGAGQFYTQTLLLQHRRHYTKEKFEISPMDPEIDIFLPFSWIEKHPPQGAWTTEDVRFNSAACLRNCTKWETGKFTLTWDEDVCTDPTAQIVGYLSATNAESQVPPEFQQFMEIMSKEAADALPKH